MILSSSWFDYQSLLMLLPWGPKIGSKRTYNETIIKTLLTLHVFNNQPWLAKKKDQEFEKTEPYLNESLTLLLNLVVPEQMLMSFYQLRTDIQLQDDESQYKWSLEYNIHSLLLYSVSNWAVNSVFQWFCPKSAMTAKYHT